ncbi:MAG: hypothetical protein AAGB04_24015 [Pseudomonadota bacterium]
MIALLRKVTGTLAQKLGHELEKKLQSTDATLSNNVDQALAIAGTDDSTSIISLHPDTWHFLENNTELLSRNFQDSLLSWVATPEGEN